MADAANPDLRVIVVNERLQVAVKETLAVKVINPREDAVNVRIVEASDEEKSNAWVSTSAMARGIGKIFAAPKGQAWRIIVREFTPQAQGALIVGRAGVFKGGVPSDLLNQELILVGPEEVYHNSPEQLCSYYIQAIRIPTS